ncbi:MAG: penicillin-binding protein [Candidatus Andersenbacteria bacterium]
MAAAFNPFRSQRSRRNEARQARRRERDRAVTAHLAGRQRRGNDRRRRIRNTVLKISVASLVLLVVGVGSLFAYLAKDLPDANGIRNRAVAQSTKIYDRNGELLFEFFGEERRTSITFDEMPLAVKQATVAVEDADFYHHPGFDITGLLRAAYNDLTGGSTQGGSTITQQLVKNAIVGGQRSFTRKIKEVILAIEIEQKFSKDEILHLYLNEIPYGSNAYGIEAAAETYFNKHAKDLSLAESAALAGMPQSPSYYSPFGPNKDALLARKDYVLDRMVKLGMIKQDEADKAKAEKLKFTKSKIEIKAPHFVFMVRELLEQQYGTALVESGGLKVTTTLDLKKQAIAETAVKEGAARNASAYGASNASLVAMEPSTGQILAYVGSADYFNDKIDGSVDVNRALRGMGSSVKPFTYLTAFQKGYPDTTTLFDVPTDFGGGYKPADFDHGSRGPVTARKALDGSLNIPAVKMLYLVGIPDMVKTATALGVSTWTKPEEYGLALGLGAVEEKLIDHTYAYSTIANRGVRVPRTAILKVEDQQNHVLEEWKPDPGTRVVDENAMLTLADVMSDDASRAYIFGAGGPLTLPDRKVGGKTGTTENQKDGITEMYVPQLNVGVWTGNDDGRVFSADAIQTAAPIAHQFMVEALKGTKPEWYPAPKPIGTGGKAILSGGIGAGKGDKVRVSKIDGKLAPKDLPDIYVDEKEFVTYHSELFYLDKDNPQGPAPKDPSLDPMFKNWEAAVAGWSKNRKDGGAPPKETSPYGAAEAQPKVQILQPTGGQVVTSSTLTAIASVQAVAGLGVVEFALDGALVGSVGAEPYAVTFPVTVPNGFHTLTVTVHDKYGGVGSHLDGYPVPGRARARRPP